MQIPGVERDKQEDVAYIYFSEIKNGESVKQLSVTDNDGEIAAVLDFSATGELLGIELFSANKQLPRMFRS